MQQARRILIEPGGSEAPDARSRIRVLVVDDQRIIRKAVRALLTGKPGLEVVGEAQSGEAAVRLVPRLRPHVVLMDLMMPGMDATEAIRRITARRLNTRVLVLTSFASDETAGPAIQSGAAGWLPKDSEPEDLLRAIRSVLGRGRRAESGSTSWPRAHAIAGAVTNAPLPKQPRGTTSGP